MIPSRALRLLTVIGALALTSCSDMSLPEQGFATHYLGGTFGPALGAQFDTSTDFAGQPRGGPSPGRTTPQDSCEATAQNRAQDIAAEGYDATLQQHVHDSVLADCRVWSKRR